MITLKLHAKISYLGMRPEQSKVLSIQRSAVNVQDAEMYIKNRIQH